MTDTPLRNPSDQLGIDVLQSAKRAQAAGVHPAEIISIMVAMTAETISAFTSGKVNRIKAFERTASAYRRMAKKEKKS